MKNPRALTISLLSIIAASLPMPALAETLLLRNADVYTVSDGIKPKHDVLIQDGKIAAIGQALTADAAKSIDLSGKRLYPGLIHASTIAGLTEISAVRATNDFAETGQINPNARSASSINPDSDLFPVIRNFGVTTLHVMPQGGASALSGRSAIVYSRGWRIEDMAQNTDAGAVLQWPSAMAPDFLPAMMREEIKKQAAATRDALERAFDAAQAYALEKPTRKNRAPDLRFEALQPVLKREMPLYVRADSAVQIREALDFCSKRALRCTLVGAADAWRYVDQIKAANVSVILGSPFELPGRRSDSFDVQYRNAAQLHAAGIRFAIAGDGSAFSAPTDGNLAFNAAQYAAFGLPAEKALHAITLGAAEILGIAATTGSISTGKSADLVVSDGDILEITSQVEAVFVQGELQSRDSRHSRLHERYRRYLQQ
jgi:imidazolonepropionase-like amidohydrolase